MIPETCVLIADGSEEMEAVIIVDVLRRAEWPVKLVGLNDSAITASRGVTITPDCAFDSIDFDETQLLIIPGGLPGVETLKNDQRILDLVNDFHHAGKWLACICAAPLVLQAAGEFLGRNITSHPSVKDTLSSEFDWSSERVVVDGPLVTSQGPGTSFDFALKLIELIDSPEKASDLAKAMVLRST